MKGQTSEAVKVVGFDPEGEPEIRTESDGRLQIVFEHMPPSWAGDANRDHDLGLFEDFDKQLEKAIGATVVWEDRELFTVEGPAIELIPKILGFLSNYRAVHPSVSPSGSPERSELIQETYEKTNPPGSLSALLYTIVAIVSSLVLSVLVSTSIRASVLCLVAVYGCLGLAKKEYSDSVAAYQNNQDFFKKPSNILSLVINLSFVVPVAVMVLVWVIRFRG